MVIGLDSRRLCGLFSLHYMARHPEAVSVSELARAGKFSAALVRAVLGSLRRSGLVERRRGSGYRLARPAGQISLLSVLRPDPSSAASSWGCWADASTCPLRGACPYSPVCAIVDRAIRSALDGISLAELQAEAASRPTCRERKRRA